MQEDIPDTQGGQLTDGLGLGEEIAVGEDCPLGIEFQFDEELFEKPGKLRAHLTRAEKLRHNQQWTRPCDRTTTTQLKNEQEKDPEVLRSMRQENPTHIKCIEGVLCHTWSPRDSPDTGYEQIVLPKRIVKYKQEREQTKEELRTCQVTEEERRLKDQEQQAMTELMLKELESNRMEMCHLTVS